MYVSAVFLPIIGSFIAGILVFVGAITKPEKKNASICSRGDNSIY